MNYKEKQSQLQKILTDCLRPLIGNDYILLDLPYYDNIGDTLIWEGTRQFLKTLPYKCLYYASKETFVYQKLKKDIVILLQGGGNMGSLYRQHTEFRKIIIKAYPNNRVVILPQSIYYEDDTYIKEDADFYRKYDNVIICARECYSFDFLKTHFSNNTLLVPDMAFFLNVHKFANTMCTGRTLYLKRIDKEFVENGNLSQQVPDNADCHDWPTYEYHFKEYDIIERCFRFLKRVMGKIHCPLNIIFRVTQDWKRNYYYRPSYVCKGIEFLNQYDCIYTTRLHVMILGLLLGKRLYLINNTSGKVVNFYNTWLKDLENVKILSSDEN